MEEPFKGLLVFEAFIPAINRTGQSHGVMAFFVVNSLLKLVMIKNNQITHNITNGKDYASGGGVEIEYGSNGSIIGNEISYNVMNTKSGYGGGIGVASTTGKTFIDRNTISHNMTQGGKATGGGVCLHDNKNHSNTLITNNIISDNSA